MGLLYRKVAHSIRRTCIDPSRRSWDCNYSLISLIIEVCNHLLDQLKHVVSR